jgi:hypothetical protein
MGLTNSLNLHKAYRSRVAISLVVVMDSDSHTSIEGTLCCWHNSGVTVRLEIQLEDQWLGLMHHLVESCLALQKPACFFRMTKQL